MALHDRIVDASIVRAPIKDPALEFLTLFREPRVVAVRRDHWLAANRTVRIADLADMPVVRLRDVPAEHQRWWASDPRPDGSAVLYGPEIRTLEEALQHVLLGDAVHITIASGGQARVSDEIVFVEITDIAPAEIQLAWRRVDRSPAVQALIATAAELFESPSSDYPT